MVLGGVGSEVFRGVWVVWGRSGAVLDFMAVRSFPEGLGGCRGPLWSADIGKGG